MQHPKYTKELLEKLCSESYSFSEVLRKTGRVESGYSSQYLKNKIQEFNIDITHFTHRLWSKGKTHLDDDRIKLRSVYKIEDIFCKNSPATRRTIRKYILKYNLIPYKCATCGCDGNWQNGIIALELDHIDGDGTNNELSNLRYLCPNCHALTETYRGKNKHLKTQK